jgi:hypothetical protein
VVGDTTEARRDCPECHGRGTILYGTQQTIVLIHNFARRAQNWEQFGTYANGEVKFTFLPENIPCPEDRVTFLEGLSVYRERRIRRATVERLAYPIVTRTFEVGSALDPTIREDRVEAVIYCRRSDATGAIVAGPLVEGADLAVTVDGELSWTLGDILGTAPEVGEAYSVAYYIRPVFRILNSPYTHRATIVRHKASPGYVQQTMLVDARMEWAGDSDIIPVPDPVPDPLP